MLSSKPKAVDVRVMIDRIDAPARNSQPAQMRPARDRGAAISEQYGG
jgi:hypothetical protein